MKSNNKECSNDDFLAIMEELKNGRIKSWYEFEMRLDIVGIDMSSDLLNTIIFNWGDYFNVYHVFQSIMMNDSVLDCNFDDFSLITTIIERDGRYMYPFPSEYNDNSDEYIDNSKFKGLDILRELDIRNPKYLLKYFLHCEDFIGSDKYFDLFYDIIGRTKLRASKMKVFEKYVGILEDKFRERKNIRMFSR